MNPTIFNGEEFARKKEEELKKRVLKLAAVPKMASLYFEEDKMGVLYTRLKQESAERIGVEFEPIRRSLFSDYKELLKLVKKTSREESLHGFMIQKPSKKTFSDEILKPGEKSGKWLREMGDLAKGEGSYESLFEPWWNDLREEILPSRDVDCLTSLNLSLIERGKWKLLPATVRAILAILEEALRLTGCVPLNAVVVGRSEIVGRPLAHVLAQRGYKVKLCGSDGVAAVSVGPEFDETPEPEDLQSAVKGADILVSATGQYKLINSEMVKKDAIVIDVGEPLGDVDFDASKEKASFITPVPGGVGPMTVVSLMENLVDIV